jgi:NAD(P)-dependent dehydrogenase (short-subunit alcohol dehydrogenase family)
MKIKRVAIVTGATQGLGRATAVFLAKLGYAIGVNYRTHRTLAQATLREVQKVGTGILVQSDVTNAADSLVKRVMKKFGRVDVLINNVGDFHYKTLDDTTVDEWNAVIINNLTSVFAMTTAVLPIMRTQREGRVICYAAAGADRGVTRSRTVPYDIAKAGVLSLARYLAREEAAHGVTINCISPGVLETSIAKNNIVPPTGRYVQIEDILKTIAFCLDSPTLTGANIEVSGGWDPGENKKSSPGN